MLKKIIKEVTFFFINWFLPVVKNKASVLMYHSIGYEDAFFSVKPEIFDRQMKYIKENGYKVVKISTFFDLLKSGADISKVLVITFDDGYKDNFLNAFPVLQKYNIPASIFLATDFIGKSMSTSDSFSLDILNNEEIEIMLSSGLVEFLPHSMSHRIFNSISKEEAILEAEGSFNAIKKQHKFCSKIFAYPKGKFTDEIVGYFKKNSWSCAVSVIEGAVSSKDSLFSLKRNSIDSQTSFNQFRAKTSGKVQYYVSMKNFLLWRENQNESREKPKIVFAINDFTTAGAQRLYVDLLKHLKSYNYDVYLFTLFQFDDKKDFYDLLSDKEIKIFKMNFGSFYDIQSWFNLFFTLIKIKPDLVISSLFFSNTIFRILKILCFYKIITIEHNTYIHKTKSEIFLDRILSFLSIKIVAVSNSVLSFTSKQEKIPESKFKVIHNGVDFKNIDSRLNNNLNLLAFKHELGFSEKDKIIINVGRLTAQKNQENLIKAFAVFNKKNSNYKLIILGEGNLSVKLSNLIKELNCEHSIKLLGSKKDLIPYYLISEYFISSSVIEGFGLAHAEALYCGLPVLTTKTAGPDEFVKEGENGYFIDNTEEGILSGLEKMSKCDLSNMKLKAKESIKDFSIEKTVQQYNLLIKECLGF